MPLNIEFKARCEDHDRIRTILQQRNAQHQGTDHQKDIYFDVPEGRLKLRIGNIENNLIYYKRTNTAGSKQSDIDLYKIDDPAAMETLLSHALPLDVVVEKIREIWWIENIKIHLDEVPGLGHFVEVEAIDQEGSGSISVKELQRQCDELQEVFGVKSDDMVAVSYSDLLRD